VSGQLKTTMPKLNNSNKWTVKKPTLPQNQKRWTHLRKPTVLQPMPRQ